MNQGGYGIRERDNRRWNRRPSVSGITMTLRKGHRSSSTARDEYSTHPINAHKLLQLAGSIYNASKSELDSVGRTFEHERGQQVSQHCRVNEARVIGKVESSICIALHQGLTFHR